MLACRASPQTPLERLRRDHLESRTHKFGHRLRGGQRHAQPSRPATRWTAGGGGGPV